MNNDNTQQPAAPPPLDSEAGQVFLADIVRLFLEPEIQRRHERGELQIPVDLAKAQVVFHVDGCAPTVRLNDEVRAVAQFWVQPKADKVLGSPIYAEEIHGVQSIQLTDSDDPNCGHVTLIRIGDQYHFGFDFVYNKDRARRLLASARQYLATAIHAGQEQMWAPFVDNLHAAMELAIKALLWTNAYGRNFKVKMKHGSIHTAFNLFAKHGNAPADHRETFNALSEARPKARYGGDETVADCSQRDAWLSHVKGLIVRTEAAVALPVPSLGGLVSPQPPADANA